jgi:DNA-binding NarL/FixJ family response regulator
VLDLELPRMDGLALARALRSLRRPVAVLVLSMHKEEQLVNAALDAGVQGYVFKDDAVTEASNSATASTSRRLPRKSTSTLVNGSNSDHGGSGFR